MRATVASVVVLLAACGSTSSNLVWGGEQPPTTDTLAGVWASGDHDIYSVGFSTIIHSANDGSGWTVEGWPANGLWGIGGSGATDVYAVGEQGVILHRSADGQWAQQPSPVSTALHHVWANAANDVYVVGDDGVILHGDGTGAWTVLPSGTSDTLWSVWASGMDVYVVGGKTGATATDSPAESLILHSPNGGQTWPREPTPSGGHDLGAVWGTSDGAVIAVGGDRIFRRAGGSAWTDVSPPGAIGLDALAGLGEGLYAAGNGVVFSSDDDGLSFHQVLGGFSVLGAWVLPRGDCYVVGVGSDGNGGPSVGAIAHGQ